MWSPSRLSISRRRVPGPRAASASAAVSTHSRGPPCPRAARTLFLTHLLACHVSDRAPFSLQTPVERSERLAGCWAVRARANPLSLGVWPFTLRFVLPSGVGLATLAEGRKAVACSRHLDPKSTQSHGEFLRLLYILAHRRTNKYFADMGDHEPGTDAFTWRRSQYFWKHKAAIGLSTAIAVARRAHLAHPPRPRQWPRASRPNAPTYADILSSTPFH